MLDNRTPSERQSYRETSSHEGLESADRLEPLRVIMRGGLNGKSLQTPKWETGSSTEMGEGASLEQVEPEDIYTARQFREEGSRPLGAPDLRVVVASVYGFSIN
ncbi:hypothetical protein STEG23_021587 [Scotinomys teguina]